MGWYNTLDNVRISIHLTRCKVCFISDSEWNDIEREINQSLIPMSFVYIDNVPVFRLKDIKKWEQGTVFRV